MAFWENAITIIGVKQYHTHFIAAQFKNLTNERLKRKKIKIKKIKNTDVQRCSKTVKLKIRKNKVKDLTASKIISSVGKGVEGKGGVGREKVYVNKLLKNANTFTFSPKMENSKVNQEAEEILTFRKTPL